MISANDLIGLIALTGCFAVTMAIIAIIVDVVFRLIYGRNNHK